MVTWAQQRGGCSREGQGKALGHEGQGKAVGREGQGDMAHAVTRGRHASSWSVVGPGRSSRERAAVSVDAEGRSAVTGLQKRKLARKKKERENTHQPDISRFSQKSR